MQRYKDECDMLCYMAKKQLNLPKNRSKEAFEGMRFKSIMFGLHDEYWELHREIDKKEFDETRILEEIGDCAAYLAGMIAKLNELIKERKRYK